MKIALETKKRIAEGNTAFSCISGTITFVCAAGYLAMAGVLGVVLSI